VRLLKYFGEDSAPCGNCDNCLNPPELFDATEAARKMLSCIYRVQQASGHGYGAGHIMDILRGKASEKVLANGHQQLSTFGIGTDWSETQWRALLRQLIAVEAVRVADAPYNTLHLADGARGILKGEAEVRLRLLAERAPTRSRSARAKPPVGDDGAPLSLAERDCLDALKAWRAQVAKEHNLPAYVIFHDATLRAIAQRRPADVTDLDGISGIGEKKRAAYGEAVLAVVSAFR
jgi:ATP-dependent DNA helicase RecQ